MACVHSRGFFLVERERDKRATRLRVLSSNESGPSPLRGDLISGKITPTLLGSKTSCSRTSELGSSSVSLFPVHPAAFSETAGPCYLVFESAPVSSINSCHRIFKIAFESTDREAHPRWRLLILLLSLLGAVANPLFPLSWLACGLAIPDASGRVPVRRRERVPQKSAVAIAP